MYSIIKNVIASRRYELGDMLGKIDTIWVQGDLTDEQHVSKIAGNVWSPDAYPAGCEVYDG